jgi:hypothetical protein
MQMMVLSLTPDNKIMLIKEYTVTFLQYEIIVHFPIHGSDMNVKACIGSMPTLVTRIKLENRCKS